MPIDPNLPPAAPLPWINPFQRAIAFAQAAHGDQRDKAGEPYICHCVRVGAALLPDMDLAVVGLLHDVLEDTSVTLAQLSGFLSSIFPDGGIAASLLDAIVLLTRPKAMDYKEYIAAIAPHFLARRAKLADLADNLIPKRRKRALIHGADPHDMARLRRRYVRAEYVLRIAERSHAV
jgi:hypothetical protein